MADPAPAFFHGQPDWTVATDRAWSAMRYFNLYRLVIAGLFAVLSGFGHLPPSVTGFKVSLILWTSLSYLSLAVVLQALVEQRAGGLVLLRNAQVLLDIVALTLLMHASGGVAGGFGILLVIAVAGACLLASRRAAVAYAALSTRAGRGETVYGLRATPRPACSARSASRPRSSPPGSPTRRGAVKPSRLRARRICARWPR